MNDDPTAPFDYELHAVRVVFGAGSLSTLPAELARAGWRRPFLISTSARAASVARSVASLSDLFAGTFDRADPHVPAASVAAALAAIGGRGADCSVTIGGGSAIGLGKAVARETGLPVVAVPTTYSGSEMTAIWGITEEGAKRTGRDARVAPRLVVYDPVLTVTLAPEATAASGMNALAHAVEAMYAADAGPVTCLLAGSAAANLAAGLPASARAPADLDARARALVGAHLAGRALALASMGLHHKICHVLGGSFGLPHAMTHAVILPHVVAFNAPAAPRAMKRVADALGARDAVEGVAALGRELGVTATLGELGLSRDQLDRAADLAVQGAYPNPRPAGREAVFAILEDAFDGRPPRPAA